MNASRKIEILCREKKKLYLLFHLGNLQDFQIHLPLSGPKQKENNEILVLKLIRMEKYS